MDENKVIFDKSPGTIFLGAEKNKRDTIFTLGSGKWSRGDKAKIRDLIHRSLPEVQRSNDSYDKKIRVNRINIFVNELYVRIRKSR